MDLTDLSRQVKLSSAGVKRRLREIVEMGLIDHGRVERPDGKVMAQYTVPDKGIELRDEIG